MQWNLQSTELLPPVKVILKNASAERIMCSASGKKHMTQVSKRSTAEVILLAVVTRDSAVTPATAEFYHYTDLIKLISRDVTSCSHRLTPLHENLLPLLLPTSKD